MPNYIGLDYGQKCIGVAIGQTTTYTASPLQVISAKQGLPDWGILDALVNQWRPIGFVIGLPLNMDGTTQPITQEAEQFAHAIQQRYKKNIYFIDESLTTREARLQAYVSTYKKNKPKQRLDAIAAAIILQDWLETQKNSVG